MGRNGQDMICLRMLVLTPADSSNEKKNRLWRHIIRCVESTHLCQTSDSSSKREEDVGMMSSALYSAGYVAFDVSASFLPLSLSSGAFFVLVSDRCPLFRRHSFSCCCLLLSKISFRALVVVSCLASTLFVRFASFSLSESSSFSSLFHFFFFFIFFLLFLHSSASFSSAFPTL